jgi:hypothetical protein
MENVEAESTSGDWSDDFGHYYHCNPDVALCGLTIAGGPFFEDGELNEGEICPWCDALSKRIFHCPHCGNRVQFVP